jgi:hypothetical protein
MPFLEKQKQRFETELVTDVTQVKPTKNYAKNTQLKLSKVKTAE